MVTIKKGLPSRPTLSLMSEYLFWKKILSPMEGYLYISNSFPAFSTRTRSVGTRGREPSRSTLPIPSDIGSSSKALVMGSSELGGLRLAM